MDHADHVALIRDGVTGPSRVWADIGAGEGAFTLALAELLGPGGKIVAVDRDQRALVANSQAMAARFPGVDLVVRRADFEAPVELPRLDGLVAANSLHYVARDRQVEVVRRLAAHLRPGGAFVVVEYDVDRGNPWVPHPFSAGTWEGMAAEAGLVETTRIGRVPSRFLDAIYASLSRRATTDASPS
jgi:SAM-dependent methyltransferase